MHAGYNTVLVSIEKEFNDTITAPEGMEFFQDTTYRPEHHTTIHGIIIAVPLEFKMQGHWDVKVGDKIYFNYMVVLQPENRLGKYWIVEAALLIARVRAGELKPLGNHILLRPIIEANETIGSLFTPVSLHKKKLDKGIVVASNREDAIPGDVVAFSKVGKFENFIEGEILYCAFNRNLYYKEIKQNGTSKKRNRKKNSSSSGGKV